MSGKGPKYPVLIKGYVINKPNQKRANLTGSFEEPISFDMITFTHQ